MADHEFRGIKPLWADRNPPDDNRLRSAHLSYPALDAHIDYETGSVTFTDVHGGEACIRFEHIPQLADAITTLANRITSQGGHI